MLEVATGYSKDTKGVRIWFSYIFVCISFCYDQIQIEAIAPGSSTLLNTARHNDYGDRISLVSLLLLLVSREAVR